MSLKLEFKSTFDMLTPFLGLGAALDDDVADSEGGSPVLGEGLCLCILALVASAEADPGVVAEVVAAVVHAELVLLTEAVVGKGYSCAPVAMALGRRRNRGKGRGRRNRRLVAHEVRILGVEDKEGPLAVEDGRGGWGRRIVGRRCQVVVRAVGGVNVAGQLAVEEEADVVQAVDVGGVRGASWLAASQAVSTVGATAVAAGSAVEVG